MYLAKKSNHKILAICFSVLLERTTKHKSMQDARDPHRHVQPSAHTVMWKGFSTLKKGEHGCCSSSHHDEGLCGVDLTGKYLDFLHCSSFPELL